MSLENDDLREYVALSDQLWRETQENFLSERMIELRLRMIENVVIRDNDRFFEKRKVGPSIWCPTARKMVKSADEERSIRIDIQCEPGWFRIIGDCIDRIAAETHAMEWRDYRLVITCVKEKFAGLRIYFDIKRKDGDEVNSVMLQTLNDSISGHLAVAETICHNTCEVCGEHGHIRGTRGEHMQTLCDHHTALRKRSETPEVLKAMFVGNVDGLDLLKLLQEEQHDELRIRRDGSPQDGS